MQGEATRGSIRRGSEIQRRILEYLLNNGENTSFTDFFWKKCEPHPYELNRYPLWVKTILLSNNGKSIAEIARTTGVNWQSVKAWARFEQRPKLAYYLGLHLQLGLPRPGWAWLSVNNTSGHAVPLGPIIQVPKTISKWEVVAAVLVQVKPLGAADDGLSREYMFGFLVGMIIGDTAKSRAKYWHRHLGLVLSKKYDTNMRIGEFTCRCAQNIGLRMHGILDQPKRRNKPHGFYQWASQASPLIDWIFNAVLGLTNIILMRIVFAVLPINFINKEFDFGHNPLGSL